MRGPARARVLYEQGEVLHWSQVLLGQKVVLLRVAGGCPRHSQMIYFFDRYLRQRGGRTVTGPQTGPSKVPAPTHGFPLATRRGDVAINAIFPVCVLHDLEGGAKDPRQPRCEIFIPAIPEESILVTRSLSFRALPRVQCT